ncbi:MAG: replication protein [Candidatus Atribacteria bacterium]|nr:replication protein [Candidatus Atribacteria bacterium]
MANPERTDGCIDIANEIVDQFLQINLSSYEWRVLWAILRKTYGYCELKNGKPYKDKNGFWVKKKMDPISYSQFEKLTGLKRWHIARAIKKLLQKNIIKKEEGSIIKYGLQKDYILWTITQTGNITSIGNTPLPKEVTKPLPKEVTTNEKNENITNEKNNTEQPLPKEVTKSLKITFNDETFKFENITEKKITKWTEAFLDINIKNELLKMEVWLAAHPNKRYQNYEKFIVGWLSRTKGGKDGRNQKYIPISRKDSDDHEDRDIPAGEW